MTVHTAAFEITLDQLFHDIRQIRQKNPIIHNISNLVVMPIIANLLLALGASPIMAHAQEELAEILALSQSLVINIGTLDKHWLDAIVAAQNIALQSGISVVFDPVGAGASQYRTKTAKKILAQGVEIIRGNASEIMALVDPGVQSKGVDSLATSTQALAAATHLAKEYHCIVVVSGAIDWIVSADHAVMLAYGTALFTKVVGMGCSLTAIIASFLTVNANPFLAAAHAVATFGLTGELAAESASGPGSFYTRLLDNLYNLKPADFEPLMARRNNDPANGVNLYAE